MDRRGSWIVDRGSCWEKEDRPCKRTWRDAWETGACLLCFLGTLCEGMRETQNVQRVEWGGSGTCARLWYGIRTCTCKAPCFCSVSAGSSRLLAKTNPTERDRVGHRVSCCTYVMSIALPSSPLPYCASMAEVQEPLLLVLPSPATSCLKCQTGRSSSWLWNTSRRNTR